MPDWGWDWVGGRYRSCWCCGLVVTITTYQIVDCMKNSNGIGYRRPSIYRPDSISSLSPTQSN